MILTLVGIFSFCLAFTTWSILKAGSKADDKLYGDDQYK